MKLEDPELADLVEAYRETQRPNDGRRRQMRARLQRATVRRPAWQVYGMTALVAAAALLVIWLGARAFDGTPQERADATMPAQAPHESAPQSNDGRVSPPQERTSETTTPPPEPVPTPELPPAREIEPRSSHPEPTRPPTVPSADTKAAPDDELTLIVQAEAALRGDQPERALRLLQLHERRHPDANTGEERLALRILALCALGRLEEGRGLRHSFLQMFSRSAYRSRIESACPRP